MKKIIVEKYINEKMIEQHNVPILFIRLIDKLLPSTALSGMKEKGLDLPNIMAAIKNDGSYDACFDTEENGVKTTIHIHLK